MKNSDSSSNNVLADLQFLENFVSNQKQEMLDKINQAIGGKKSEEQTTILVASVADTLGELKARLQVVEMALAQGQQQQSILPNAIDTSQYQESIDNSAALGHDQLQLTNTLPTQTFLLSNVLTTLNNFHYTETGKDNYEYNWTGEEIETNIKLSVCRQTEKELRIQIVSTLRSDALENLQLKMDGEELYYKVFFDGELQCISATLPCVEGKTDSSELSIIYPDPCSPQSLGNSTDNRYLGIAIHSVIVADSNYFS